jgi:hypothetical protein
MKKKKKKPCKNCGESCVGKFTQVITLIRGMGVNSSMYFARHFSATVRHARANVMKMRHCGNGLGQQSKVASE